MNSDRCRILNPAGDQCPREALDPDAVTAATDAYRNESDVLRRFLDQRCLTGHGTVGSSDLFAAWSAWCKAEGEEPGTMTALAAALQNKGFDNYTQNGRRRWRGLGLTADDDGGVR